MKTILLALSIIICVQLSSQPKLTPVFQLPDPPDLTLRQLVQYEVFATFNHNEGIIIYDLKEDQWKLFKYLDQYREFGQIKKIQRIQSSIIISLEKGGVIFANSRIKTFKTSIIDAFPYKNKILILSSDLDTTERQGNYFDEYDYYEADHLIMFDPEKDETDTIKLSRTINSVKCCEISKDIIWIYSLDMESEDWFPEFLKVDLKGNVTSIESPGTNHNLIRSIKTFHDNIFILRDSSLFSFSGNKPMKKVMDIDPINRYSAIREFENGFYIFPTQNDSYHDTIRFSKIDLSAKTLQVISLPVSLNSSDASFVDYQVTKNMLFNYSDYLQLVYGQSISEPFNSQIYPIRDGITDMISNLTEDEKEIWFITSFTGIHRFIKTNSTWKSYTQYINFQQESSEKLNCDVITMNEDFVFIPLINKNGKIQKYILFNRKNETFVVMSKQEFIKKFLYNGERFEKYTGEDLVEENPENTLKYLTEYGDEWNLFLFLYELPISGNLSWDHGNCIISNNYCTILSFFLMHPQFWLDGIIIKLKDDSTLYFMYAQKSIQDFEDAIHPFIIGGDAYRVFAASRGNFGHGLLIYDLPTRSCKTEKSFYETLNDFSFLQGTGNNVMIGSYYPSYRLYSVDVQTFEITNLSKYINGTPRNCKSTENYIYVATDKGLIYFDHDLNYQGKLNAEQSILSRTKFNLYLVTGEKVFLIKDNDE